jgi:hypothetical protein
MPNINQIAMTAFNTTDPIFLYRRAHHKRIAGRKKSPKVSPYVAKKPKITLRLSIKHEETQIKEEKTMTIELCVFSSVY